MDSKIKTPQSPKGQWFLGNLRAMRQDPIVYSATEAIRHDLVLLKIVHRRLYVTANADIATKALVSESFKFSRGSNYKRLSSIGGNGLITVENGDFWKRQRRLAQPGFHKERLNSFFQCFIDFSYETGERWTATGENEVVSMSSEMSRFTLKAVGKTLFNLDLAEDSKEFPQDMKYLLRFINLRHYQLVRPPLKWPFPSHTEFRKRLRNMDSVVYGIIDSRMAQKERQEHDLLEMFLESTDAETGEKMDRKHIRDELFTMLVAGFETSSVALTWVWYSLYHHPDVAEKIMDEVNRVVGTGPVKPEHLMQLTYIQQVISETMRMYPPVFAIPRDIAEDTELGGFMLKKDKFFLVSIYGLHHNPKYWPDPEKFDPERFSKENRETQVKGAYMPFGSGQRICIGSQFAMMEMTAIIAALIRDFKPEPRPGYTPQMIAAITTNVSEGMPMYLKKRQ